MAHHHQHHRPLHCRRDPRRVSSGRSAYVYRREAGVESGFGGHHRFPTLYTTKKIQDKVGLAFYHCPNFKELRESDPSGDIKSSSAASNRLSHKEFSKEVEKIEEKEKRKKEKRKGKKKDPTIKIVREHLRKIIKYHCQKVNEAVPSVYPILGPVNSDSDEGEGESGGKRGGLKMLNTKGELHKY